MNVICYGDSNTYGYDPRSYLGGRYGPDHRWVDILAAKTGWNVSNWGENGREIPHSAFALHLLERQLDALAPFEGICLMLGSNDLLCGASPADAESSGSHCVQPQGHDRVPQNLDLLLRQHGGYQNHRLPDLRRNSPAV